jgi:hypothetical protein
VRTESRAGSAFLLSFLVAATPVEGQPADPTRGRIPVDIEMVDSFPFEGAAAVIIREPGKQRREKIVLPRATATPSTVGAAFFVLSILHGLDSGCPKSAAVVRVPEAYSGYRSSSWRPYDDRVADNVVMRLRRELTANPGLSKATTRIWVNRILTREFIDTVGPDFNAACPGV